MTLRFYLTIMSITTVVCWAVFSFVLWTINPETTNWIGFILFYLSLFLAFSGTAAIIGFLVRFMMLKHELAFHSVKIAFRQSFLFAFMVVAILLLLAFNLCNWINLSLLIIGLSMLEFFLLSCKKKLGT